MKKIIGILLIAFIFIATSCNKQDKLTGVCYCKFFSGDTQEYDLRTLDRQAQEDACSVHDKNAANFAGSCKLQ